jgi:ribosomal protein S18 acetylase RimI-like enzyme
MDDITFMPVRPEDEQALFALFAEVRAEELAMAAWDPTLRDAVLRQQFAAQRRGHRAQYPAASELLILLDNRPVGWTVLDRSGPMWHCVDIAIAREHRRRKIATRVIRAWQDEAAAAGCGIGLSVMRTNRAARALYDGLGFRPVGQTETHWMMEWRG